MSMEIPEPTETESLIMLLEQHRDILKDSETAMINGKEYNTQSMVFKDMMKGFDEAIRFARLIKQ